jgi:hypothetical protein
MAHASLGESAQTRRRFANGGSADRVHDVPSQCSASSNPTIHARADEHLRE